MKMYFHGQIGLQEFPKVNSNTVFIGLLSCLSGEKEQLHKQRRSPFSALIIQPLRHGHLSSSPCPSPVLPSSPSSFLSALQLCFCPSGEDSSQSCLCSQGFPGSGSPRVEVLQLPCVFCLLSFLCKHSGGGESSDTWPQGTENRFLSPPPRSPPPCFHSLNLSQGFKRSKSVSFHLNSWLFYLWDRLGYNPKVKLNKASVFWNFIGGILLCSSL